MSEQIFFAQWGPLNTKEKLLSRSYKLRMGILKIEKKNSFQLRLCYFVDIFFLYENVVLSICHKRLCSFAIFFYNKSITPCNGQWKS